MKHLVTAGGATIVVTVRKHSRARRIILSVRRDGEVVLTMPKYGSVKEALSFAHRKSEWLAQRLREIVVEPAPSKAAAQRQFIIHRAAANVLVKKLLADINTVYNFPFRKVVIRHQKSRWGSCTKSGNLSFNYKIVFLPEALQRYIVAHELCHLKEMNHGKRFWQLVEQTVPDHVMLRRQLRRVPV